MRDDPRAPWVPGRQGGAGAPPRALEGKRLDLGLLVNAEHDGAIRRVEVKPDNIGDLLLEQRVVRNLEALHDMRLQTGIGPDAPHARGRDTHRFGHQRAAPVRGIGRRLLHGLCDHPQPCFHGQRRHPRRPRIIALEASHAFIEIPLLPAPDRPLRHTRASHDLEGAVTFSRGQHDPGPSDQLARRIAVSDQGLKFSTVGGAKVKADVITSHTPNIARQSALGNPTSGVEH